MHGNPVVDGWAVAIQKYYKQMDRPTNRTWCSYLFVTLTGVDYEKQIFIDVMASLKPLQVVPKIEEFNL